MRSAVVTLTNMVGKNPYVWTNILEIWQIFILSLTSRLYGSSYSGYRQKSENSLSAWFLHWWLTGHSAERTRGTSTHWDNSFEFILMFQWLYLKTYQHYQAQTLKSILREKGLITKALTVFNWLFMSIRFGRNHQKHMSNMYTDRYWLKSESL